MAPAKSATSQPGWAADHLKRRDAAEKDEGGLDKPPTLRQEQATDHNLDLVDSFESQDMTELNVSALFLHSTSGKPPEPAVEAAIYKWTIRL